MKKEKTIQKGWPDWRKAKDYASMKKLNLDQWAWEFLKRNREYIEEWERVSKDLTEEQKKYVNEDPMESIWNDNVPFVPELGNATKWGLPSGYLNPDPNLKLGKISFIPFGGISNTKIISEFKNWPSPLLDPDYRTGKVTIEFNFLQPINPQIAIAKKGLLELQNDRSIRVKNAKKAFKPRRFRRDKDKWDEWILLLRILDAKATGVKDKEIASILFPNECSVDPEGGIKRVYDKREQAMRYVTQDFRHIPYSEE